MSLKLKSTHAVVRFSLKESMKKLELEPNRDSLIMLHFSSGGRRFKKSMGYKCSYNQWDHNKQRIKTGKSVHQFAFKINKKINDIEDYALNEFSKMNDGLGLIDLNKLSMIIGLKIKGAEIDYKKQENKKIIFYVSELVDSKKNRINITTHRSYKQTLRLLNLYEKKYNEVLSFEDIDLNFYRKFVNLLEQENYSLNSIGKHIKNLKIFLNDALINGVSSNTIFKHRSFKILKEVTTDIYLTDSEIKTLAGKDFSNRPRIELARDIFLIGCYTGQRVSDYNGLTNKNIEIIDGHKFIKIHQKKTDHPVHIPITKDMKRVMNRHNGNFPPKLSEPILRRNIKTACSTSGFKDLISVSFTKGGKHIKKEVPKYKLVKTHTARRSFCTNYYIAGKPIQNIMLFSGHKTEREFLKYIRIEKKQEALAVLKSGFFK